jgi:hypothetical protein
MTEQIWFATKRPYFFNFRLGGYEKCYFWLATEVSLSTTRQVQHGISGTILAEHLIITFWVSVEPSTTPSNSIS